jgi:hypothetical protein
MRERNRRGSKRKRGYAMDEVEAAKERGYVIFKTSQKASRLGPYSRWCKEMLKPQIYVHVTGKRARTEMDLIFVKFDREKAGEAMAEAIKKLYQANADGDERFVQRAFARFGPGTVYNTVKCKTTDQAERIARGYVEIYNTIVLPVISSPVQ